MSILKLLVHQTGFIPHVGEGQAHHLAMRTTRRSEGELAAGEEDG
jgi:hypothetical protein